MEDDIQLKMMEWERNSRHPLSLHSELLRYGREKDLEEAIQRTQRETILYIIQHRFGDPFKKIKLSLEQMNPEQIDEALKVALDAESIDQAAQSIAQLTLSRKRRSSQSQTSKPK